MTDPDRRPTVEPTAVSHLVVAALLGAGVMWIVAQTLLYAGQSLPVLGPPAWVTVGVLAAATAAAAARSWWAIQKRHQLPEPRDAVTRLLLGKTACIAGAALGAAYLMLAWVSKDGWPSALAQGRIIHGLVAAVLCGVWSAAGWLLERSCRIPHEPDHEEPEPRPDDR
jgi:hypothetical protein